MKPPERLSQLLDEVNVALVHDFVDTAYGISLKSGIKILLPADEISDASDDEWHRFMAEMRSLKKI